MAKASVSKRRQKGDDETAVRERILEAAFAACRRASQLNYTLANLGQRSTRKCSD